MHESFMPRDAKVTAYGHCYYALILAHLIKSGVPNDDNSISSCTKYASHLAFEIYKYDPVSLTLCDERYEEFKRSYKDRFIIADGIINRLHGEFGLIKSLSGGAYAFSLAYSFYYFLGQYLASNYRDCKDLVSNLIESSYVNSNSLILIFTIHHAGDMEIIDEILAHTMCAIDGVQPARLDHAQTEIFDAVLSHFKGRVIEHDDGVEKERDKERELRDSSELKDSNNKNKSDDLFLNQIYQCHKNMDVLSQILKNKYSILEKDKVYEIVEIITDAGLRLANLLLPESSDIEELILYVQKAYLASESYKPSKPKDQQINDIKRMTIFRIFVWVMNNIEKTVSAINGPEINEIINRLRINKNTPAHDLIYYFYSIDTANLFDISHKRLLVEILGSQDKENINFIRKILYIRTMHYMKTHLVRHDIKQSVEHMLRLEDK